MNPTDKTARVAGAIYLSMVLIGPFSLMYVPGKLIVRGNAAATARNILNHEMLFRLGIVADLIGLVIFLFLALALYRLFNGVNKIRASLMVALVLVSVAIGFMNALSNIGALILFQGADFLSVFEKPQREALAMLFLRLHSQGNTVNEVFWGLWLFPLAMLAYRSKFLPRFLGIWLALGGSAWLLLSLTGVLLPQYQDRVFRIFQPAFFGEIALMLWLLIKGAKWTSE